MKESSEQLAAELYDLSVPDWEGEIDFYRELAREVKARGKSLLEVACGSVLQTWERKPMRLHCVFRFEMEHLLRRVGFEDRVVYGDFFKNPLSETSSDMIWMARKL